MKFKLFIFLFAIITTVIYGQDFAPLGATWHYSYQTINPNLISYVKIESVKDTTINGKICEKLKDNISTEVNYVYSKNDSVFVYKDGSFNLLYDFGATTGEIITLGSYYKAYNGLPLKMTIDSVKTIQISGQERKVQFVTCGDGMIIEFGGKVIQGIGNTNYLFPTLDLSPEGPLRCYQESNSTLFINPFYKNTNWNKTDCEQLIVINDLPKLERENSLILYPNPTNDFLNVSGIEFNTEYRIFDMTGRKVMEGNLKETQIIKVQQLDNGVYFAEIKLFDTFTKRKFIKK